MRSSFYLLDVGTSAFPFRINEFISMVLCINTLCKWDGAVYYSPVIRRVRLLPRHNGTQAVSNKSDRNYVQDLDQRWWLCD